ncbi:hypothetical protein [Candidatus Borrarchaeum sp.]|uniref:hypothetical protein n=1 Tax=Candidatus Borrarchaeum sp. TaxID=2846742 RepID=UPI00257F2E72|nr:hypothetical protein [Candidatus Borrarchaeum sp.]
MDYSDILTSNLAWLETMYQKGGYGGPVVHYWKDSLEYIGPGIDWRYEGLLTGLITFFKKSDTTIWLRKAENVAQDIIVSQLRNSSFRNSKFEANPGCGGTPHEAAVDIGLLELAKILKTERKKWKKYFFVADRNLKTFHLSRLFDKSVKAFKNSTRTDFFVPNKIATTIEALIKHYELSSNANLLRRFVIPAGDFILTQQILNENEPIFGGIYQSANSKTPFVMSFYNARCIPALILLYRSITDERYLDAAMLVGKFLEKMALREGGFAHDFSFVENKWIKSKYPIWIAGSAEVVRALLLLNEFGGKFSVSKHIEFIKRGLDYNGGFRTSIGINFKNKEKSTTEYETNWKDNLHVAGWNTMVFRLFSMLSRKIPEFEKITEKSFPTLISRCKNNFILIETQENISVIQEKENKFKLNFLFPKKSKYSLGRPKIFPRKIIARVREIIQSFRC